MELTAIERIIDAGSFRSDEAIDCPFCGYSHPVSDPDVSSAVVSYWGDNRHNFSCFECDEDFRVKEVVIRHFETAKTDAEFD